MKNKKLTQIEKTGVAFGFAFALLSVFAGFVYSGLQKARSDYRYQLAVVENLNSHIANLNSYIADIQKGQPKVEIKETGPAQNTVLANIEQAAAAETVPVAVYEALVVANAELNNANIKLTKENKKLAEKLNDSIPGPEHRDQITTYAGEVEKLQRQVAALKTDIEKTRKENGELSRSIPALWEEVWKKASKQAWKELSKEADDIIARELEKSDELVRRIEASFLSVEPKERRITVQPVLFFAKDRQIPVDIR